MLGGPACSVFIFVSIGTKRPAHLLGDREGQPGGQRTSLSAHNMCSHSSLFSPSLFPEFCVLMNL